TLRYGRGLAAAERSYARLDSFQASSHNLFGRLGGATGNQVDGVLGRLCLDHHDRDIARIEQAAGDHHVEGGLLELGVGRETDPLALDESNPGTTDGTGERQAGDLGGRRGGVDRKHVVSVLRVKCHHRDDDLNLVT